MPALKLAIVCRPFSFHGGIETATAGLMGELLRRGHAVDLVSTAAQDDVAGATVRRIRTPAFPSTLRLLGFAFAARRVVARAGYHVVQSHERGLLQDIYRAGEGTHRGYLSAMGRRRARANPYHRLVCALEARIFALRSARHIVAISQSSAGEIRALYATPADRTSVVYNGVDLDRFHPDNRARHRAAVRGSLGLAERTWVVLFVGSGFERKGLGSLIEAVGRLGDRHVHLVVAGKGDAEPYRRRATDLGLGERIHWLGPRQDVERLYAMADAVALPAVYEPFGNVHLEALASGVPVLSTAGAGGSEVIGHGESGWIVPETGPDAIRSGLDAIRSLTPSRAAAAARKAAEPSTYGAQADALEAIYRRLTATSGA